MIANASASSSPRPKSSGAEPIPPKLPQPRPTLESSRPVPPSRRYSTRGAYLSEIGCDSCDNRSVAGYVVHERELESRRDDGDTASRTVAIDARTGSELLELHVTRYDPGRSLPRALHGVQEILYAASGRGRLVVDDQAHELEAGTGVYLAAGESYEVESRGPEELLTVSVIAPQTNGATPVGPRMVRPADQPPPSASGDREFRCLVTDRV